ncbi:MAG: DNA repair protein RadA [Chromatiales bacterium]|nr:DNA repair protein RadA [Chromatiales bacterium]
MSAKSVYRCDACGGQQPKWAGQCPDCGAWNSLHEVALSSPAGGARRRGGYAGVQSARVQRLGEVERGEAARLATGSDEFDRALGGGLVAGSVVLIGGDPGIGKSTLLLQTAAALSGGRPVLYASGEESPAQIALRGERLGLDAARVGILAETSVEAVLAASEAERAAVLIVDSIQTAVTERLQSAPGSVAQVRECAGMLVEHAKRGGCATLLIGHVTKEGALAGPRVLEHMVDCVLYFDGDPGERYRVLRAVKNRFGAANELGIFAMTGAGLKPVSNPSAIFLARHEHEVPGSLVMVTREGTRPLLVELQALVDTSPLGNPRRVAVGLEHNRLAMLLAVVHRHAGITLADQDVFVNAVGGVRITETAADLPLVLSALSSLRGRALPRGLVAFGEIGLTGEVRPVPNGEERIREAAKHGFTAAIVPQANVPRRPVGGMSVTGVTSLTAAIDAMG